MTPPTPADIVTRWIDHAGDLMSDVPYQISVHVDYDGQSSRIHTQHCPDERDARNTAVNTLLRIYLHLVHPYLDGSEQRMFWCELTPGHWADNRWEPDPDTGGDVDVAYLDNEHGAITFDLAASLQRWQPPRIVRHG